MRTRIGLSRWFYEKTGEPVSAEHKAELDRHYDRLLSREMTKLLDDLARQIKEDGK